MANFSDPTNYEMQVVENFGRIRDRLTLRLANPHASLDVSQFFLDKACLGFFKCSSILIQICQLLIARDRRCWSSSGFACSVKQAKLLIGSKLLLAIQIWHRRNQQLWLADITAPQHSISSRWITRVPFCEFQMWKVIDAMHIASDKIEATHDWNRCKYSRSKNVA